MPTSLTVRKVSSQADFDAFLTFPWTLYRGDPNWVPPLVSMQRAKLDPQKNAAWQHMEGDYFLARRGEQVVGTVAAFVNHRHDEFHGERAGFFGLFELVDDAEVARALLDTAAEAVRARGATVLRGPASFSTNEECGVLVEGFDGPPVILYPYNPPYYARLVEQAGLRPVMELYGYHLTLQGMENGGAADRMLRLIEKNNARRGITVRTPNTARLAEEFAALKAIYNDAWEKNWGFVPLTDAELDELVENLGMFFDPQLTIFAEVEGQPVGFLLGLPDLNQAIQRAYPRPGKPELLTKAQIAWHWKVRSKITRIRVPLMGVRQGFRGIGVEAAMFGKIYENAARLAAQRGWQYADGGWVLETNEPMQRLCERFDGRIYRRFRFYERALT